jgi:pimeloyl-ACP methyl ester carboxylesterase
MTARQALATTRHEVGLPTLAYLDVGPRSPAALVLLHSLGADHRMWRRQVEVWSADSRVIAPDSRGHGASEGAGSVSVEEWVGDLHRVLEDADVHRAVLIGLSLGGIQAIAYAATHPDRVTALVVADSFVALEPEVARSKVRHLADDAVRRGMPAVADSYVDETFLVPPQPAEAQCVRAAIAGMSVPEYVESVRACFEVDITDRLSRVVAPTLVLWGERDGKTPRPLSERIRAGIAGADLREVPDAGHLSNVDSPGHFTRLVDEFMDHQGGVPVHGDLEPGGRATKKAEG